MRLNAVAKSNAISETLPSLQTIGHVHSAYSQVINIAYEGGWLSLHSQTVPRSPYSVIVEAWRDLALSQSFLRSHRGEQVTLSRSSITLGRGIEIDLTNASRFSCRLKPLGDLSPNEIETWLGMLLDSVEPQSQSPFLTSLLLRLGHLGNCLDESNPFYLQSSRLIEGIEAAYGSGYDSFCEQISYTLGFGAGLTPSGDDLITGMLATSHFLASDSKLAKYLKVAVTENYTSTTLPSYFMLRAACSGLYPELLCETLRSLPLSNENLHEALNTLRSFGATSGDDMLAGVILAMKLLQSHWGRS